MFPLRWHSVNEGVRQRGRNRDILGQRLGNPGAEPLARDVPRGDLARGTVAQCVEDECPALDAKGVLAEVALGHAHGAALTIFFKSEHMSKVPLQKHQ